MPGPGALARLIERAAAHRLFVSGTLVLAPDELAPCSGDPARQGPGGDAGGAGRPGRPPAGEVLPAPVRAGAGGFADDRCGRAPDSRAVPRQAQPGQPDSGQTDSGQPASDRTPSDRPASGQLPFGQSPSGRHRSGNPASARWQASGSGGPAATSASAGEPAGVTAGAPAAGPRSLALLSPDEPGFWAHVTGEPEFADGCPDPLDRWSARVIGALAAGLGARAFFPFGGPPWHPFLGWAARSGRFFASPVRLYVHDRMGLWASFRGAILLEGEFSAPPGRSPCLSCLAQPCKSACPVNAFASGSYDAAACHDWLSRPEGAACLARGCTVRRACPVSSRYGRLESESAHHMRHFHP